MTKLTRCRLYTRRVVCFVVRPKGLRRVVGLGENDYFWETQK